MEVFYSILLNLLYTADLTAMLSNSNDNKLNESALENIEQFESATENEKTISNTETAKAEVKKKTGIAKNILWIIAAVAFFRKKRQTKLMTIILMTMKPTLITAITIP